MGIYYVFGDLFKSTTQVIAHGVNCKGAFNKGIAYYMRHRFPTVYDAYKAKMSSVGWKLGDIQIVPVQDENIMFVANLATQRGYGYKASQGEVYVDYDALNIAFDKLLNYCYKAKLSLGIPRIGAGLAGGDWVKIEGIILENLEKYPVDLTVYFME